MACSKRLIYFSLRPRCSIFYSVSSTIHLEKKLDVYDCVRQRERMRSIAYTRIHFRPFNK